MSILSIVEMIYWISKFHAFVISFAPRDDMSQVASSSRIVAISWAAPIIAIDVNETNIGLQESSSVEPHMKLVNIS